MDSITVGRPTWTLSENIMLMTCRDQLGTLIELFSKIHRTDLCCHHLVKTRQESSSSGCVIVFLYTSVSLYCCFPVFLSLWNIWDFARTGREMAFWIKENWERGWQAAGTKAVRTYTYMQIPLGPPFSLHAGYHHFYCLHCTLQLPGKKQTNKQNKDKEYEESRMSIKQIVLIYS